MDLIPTDSNRGHVGVLPVTFLIIGGNKLHQSLILSENFLYNFCSSCCNLWCRIFKRGAVHNICLVLKFRKKAAYDISNNIYFPIFGLIRGQLFGLAEFLMGFTRMCFERDPYFLDLSKAIPGPDRLS